MLYNLCIPYHGSRVVILCSVDHAQFVILSCAVRQYKRQTNETNAKGCLTVKIIITQVKSNVTQRNLVYKPNQLHVIEGFCKSGTFVCRKQLRVGLNLVVHLGVTYMHMYLGRPFMNNARNSGLCYRVLLCLSISKQSLHIR